MAATPDESPIGDGGSLPLAADVPTVARSKQRRRTWPQRMLLTLDVVVILACFATAIVLVVARNYGNAVARVDINAPTAATQPGTTLATPSTDPEGATPSGTSSPETTPPPTFPQADPEAKNFLITGADNNECSDPDSPYGGGLGERSSERSDTIMVMRLNPATNQSAVLSFPRDLWLDFAGGGTGRINEVYVKDDPRRLKDTILENFGIPIDHWIQVDFCAFKEIVDAVGGVSVPFSTPVRDRHTGLNVPDAGCYEFSGDHALAYVRSRHLEYLNADGKWKEDPAADLGRISRQQDFLGRALSAALDEGVTNPGVAQDLIESVLDNIVFDDDLTLRKMLEFVGVLRHVDPNGIGTYQIEVEPRMIAGNAVLKPKIDGDNMQAILRIFKGEAPLVGAPDQSFETTTTSTTSPVTTTTSRNSPTTTRPPSTTTSTVQPTVPADTTPAAVENDKGIVPPDVSC